MSLELAHDLIAHGIPVVVCTPRKGWKPGWAKGDLIPPDGWNTITADQCDLSGFRPGIDTLAMVAGHGVDVVDIDSKVGGSPDDLPAFARFGAHRTPSGGWHYLVRSTGYAKLSPFIVGGKVVGDYCGGTEAGGGRLLVYLPGSTRPKYPNGGYTIEEPVDLDVLLESEPDDDLVAILIGAAARRDTVPGSDAATSAEVEAFLADHDDPNAIQCAYGRAAIKGMKEAAKTAKDAKGGRHGWAVKSCTRLVELMRAGCASRTDYATLRDTLDRIKAEGGTDIDDVMRWALANAKGTSECGLHNPPPLPEPEPVEPVDLADARDVFARWLGNEYDLDALHFVLALAAVERMDGDAPWGLVVSGSGNAKTETVSAAKGAGAIVTSTITSEGALLSATSTRERAQDATGGLLRRLGGGGILVIKDVTSILSMNRDARAAVLGAMREVADGFWERNVGTDGGKSLNWQGRLVTIGAVTTAWDTHHGVIAAFGDRFLLLRIDSTASRGRLASGRQSLANIGHEEQMRAELRSAFGGVIAGMAVDGIHVSEEEGEVLLALANIVTLARTAVERDHQGKVVDAHAPEAPTRLVKYLGQMLRGGIAIGMDRFDALRLAVRVAHDCVPPLRLAALKAVYESPGSRTAEIAKTMQRPWSSVDRALQELHLLGLVEVDADGVDAKWRYRIAADVDGAALGDLLHGGRPFTRNVTTRTQGHRESGKAGPASLDSITNRAHLGTDISGEGSPSVHRAEAVA